MIVAVMGFLALVSLLTYLAAWIAEGGVRRLGLPTRWIWLAAMGAPFVLLLVPLGSSVAGAAPGATAFGVVPLIELPAVVVGEAFGPGVMSWLPPVLAAGWSLWSVLLAALLIRSHVSLASERSQWSHSSVSGRDVYVSADRGPAVAGILRPWIVVPGWALTLPRRELDLVVLHEEEHLRARDTLLLAVALLFVVLAPWNPGTWLHLRRLKTAVEVDCDRRVLRRAPDPAAYGGSLLSVAARSAGLSSGLAAFTERPGSLRARILAMTEPSSRWTPVRSLALVLVALGVGVQACYVESPILVIGAGDDESRPSEVLAPEPTFTPFTDPPRIRNRDEVVAAMDERYPPLLRDAGIGGTVRIYFFIDEDGTVRDARIDESSGHEALDRAALAVADVYRFEPALNGERPVPVWVSFPITFQVG